MKLASSVGLKVALSISRHNLWCLSAAFPETIATNCVCSYSVFRRFLWINYGFCRLPLVDFQNPEMIVIIQFCTCFYGWLFVDLFFFFLNHSWKSHHQVSSCLVHFHLSRSSGVTSSEKIPSYPSFLNFSPSLTLIPCLSLLSISSCKVYVYVL